MKSSFIRGLLIFAGGAATAALASGFYPPEPMTAGEFQERLIKLSAQVEALGAYVAVAENGRVGIFTDPAACIPPVPPNPVMPPNGVDSRTLRIATLALITHNEGILMGENGLVYEVGRCKPYAGMTIRR